VLHAIVTRNLIHQPCGSHNRRAVCMKDGQCSKDFPKAFRSSTSIPAD
jgi:hypothetical protein